MDFFSTASHAYFDKDVDRNCVPKLLKNTSDDPTNRKEIMGRSD